MIFFPLILLLYHYYRVGGGPPKASPTKGALRRGFRSQEVGSAQKPTALSAASAEAWKAPVRGFHKSAVHCLGVPITRIKIFWDLYCGFSYLGELPFPKNRFQLIFKHEKTDVRVPTPQEDP